MPSDVHIQHVGSYSVTYYAGGKSGEVQSYSARIAFHKVSPGTTKPVAAAAYFYRNPARMPATDEMTGPDGFISLHYPLEDFPAVLDLLRNEKPVDVRYSTNAKMGWLATREEPVGEGAAGDAGWIRAGE